MRSASREDREDRESRESPMRGRLARSLRRWCSLPRTRRRVIRGCDEVERAFDPRGTGGGRSAACSGRASDRECPGRGSLRGPDEIDDDAVRKTILDLEDRSSGIYLVAEREGTVVGHAFLERLSLAVTSHVVRLTIAVHEGHQSQGVGRALMNELLRWAQTNPRVEKVELQVRSSNERAIALYRSLGFVEEGRKTRRLKIGQSEYLDDVYMALWVGP